MDSRPTAVLSGVTGAFATGVPKTLTVQGHWGVPVDCRRRHRQPDRGRPDRRRASCRQRPTPDPDPPTSTINFPSGDTMANGIVAPLNGSGQSSFVYKTTLPGKTTHLILDLSGYFE